MLVKLVSNASKSLEAFSVVHEGVMELTKRVTELHIKHSSKEHDDDHGEENHNNDH